MNTPETVLAYNTLFNESGIKIGDTIRITRSVPDYYLGWSLVWNSGMDKYIGETGKVDVLANGSFRIDKAASYYYPIYSVELVNKAFVPESFKTDDGCPVIVQQDGTVTIASHSIQKELMQKIMEAVDRTQSKEVYFDPDISESGKVSILNHVGKDEYLLSMGDNILVGDKVLSIDGVRFSTSMVGRKVGDSGSCTSYVRKKI